MYDSSFERPPAELPKNQIGKKNPCPSPEATWNSLIFID
ncbi:hypothetical protein LEP1GSC133_0696 [Leptospira borgpetersenii serovar Pomona str. 200901868]|uniref:Uncharacterized protein n=1 Tax=Leptospira borgpetersenii serovar Pomona str. 200901868 TaxID=1192866 RepID=M6VWH0_LEPBO|nr:hypothetical protein LEP1GSC133_0696 [Leptospira borgpetersenii serovar Pomona str. 200901868]